MSDAAASYAQRGEGPSRAARSARARLALRLLERFDTGALTLELPNGEGLSRMGALPGPAAVVKLNNWRAVRRLMTRGDIGFAEGYMAGDWSTPDLVTLLTWALFNETSLTPAWQGHTLQRLVDRARHLLRANTRRGAKKNIAAHYDLGNDFYAAWLDASMTYSSALYASESDTLDQAQDNKLARVVELLDVAPGASILEIGCGWGALAERLVTKHGATVTGLTLSRQQRDVAEARVRAVDPSGLSTIRMQDYRDVTGSYDRIVSIEMFEAAGEAYWPGYFAKLHACLKPGGIAVLQVISIEEKRFEAYRRRPDFIQSYIFPGGMLPAVSHMHALAVAAGLELEHVELFGKSYAHTLRDWRARFLSAWPTLKGDVASERFRNMWEYYFAYCEAGFDNGATDVGLYRLVRR